MISARDFAFKQIIFLVPKEGEKLSFKNDNVIITNKDGKIIHQSTCYRLFAIFIVGHITITSGLIQRARKFGFAIVFMTVNYRQYHVISHMGESNVLLRKKQYTYESIEGARSLTHNKITNQIYMLKSKRIKTDFDRTNIRKMEMVINNLNNQKSIAALMGSEGSAAKCYFESYFDNVEWKGRKPRIKPDMINAVLDIGYTQLFCFIEAILAVYGFDLFCGIMHRQFYMRKSLVCDMVEPFRVIIDKKAKAAINLGQFQEKDFKIINGKWCLNFDKSAKYGSVFMEALLENREEIFLYLQSFYRSFMKGTLDTNFPTWYI